MAIGGFSYQPSAPVGPGMQQAGAAGVISPQEVVRLLSLRLPKQLPNAPAPAALLHGAGSGGADLSSLMRMLMQAFGQNQEAPAEDYGGEDVRTTPINGDAGNTVQPGGPTRRDPGAPRVVIGDEGGRTRGPDDPAMTDVGAGVPQADPLFDAGPGPTPRVRGMSVGAKPLF